MTIKYEPVFGDQSLFDNAPEDAELAVKDNSDAWFYTVGKGRNTGLLSLDSSSIKIAMRRIIKTPTWTRADQEAGVLPPVGAKYLAGSDNRELECLYNDATGNVWGFDSRGAVFGYPLGYCRPIETPEEKAKRLEDEFIKQFTETPATSIESYYTYKLGLRDAYRKLKAPTND